MSVVTETGDRLFAFFQTVVPLPATKSGKASTPSVKTLDAGLNKFYAEARLQRKKMRPGLFRRARVAFYLQQRLLAAGYPPALVRQVLFAMLLAAFVG